MRETDETLILVNESDEEIGTASKLGVHRDGRLHRAFSVFITDPAGNILIHRRADEKYHSGGLWTNATCGHPRPGEATISAAARRLREEMGISADLTEAGAFTYRAPVDNGLIEHELDHVFVGSFDGQPLPDESEAQEWRWISPHALRDWIARDPDAFTVWFEQALYTSGLGTTRSSTFADERTPGTPPPG